MKATESKRTKTDGYNCVHDEVVEYENGRKLGRCKNCPRVMEYDAFGEKPPVDVTAEFAVSREAHKVSSYRYHLDNREKILKDVADMGMVEARQKWAIPSTTFYRLLHRWYGTQPRRTVSKQLPPLPAYDSAWSDDLKIEWMRAYNLTVEAQRGNSEKCRTETGEGARQAD